MAKQGSVSAIGCQDWLFSHQLCLPVRFGDTGLADLLMASGIVGSGSEAGVIEGLHDNHAVRTHKAHIPS